MGTPDLPLIDSLWDYERPEVTELKFRELLPAAGRSGDPSYYAQLLTQLARTLSLQRKFDDAHETLNKAAELIVVEDMPVAEVRYLLERGRTFNTANERERAVALFREAYDKALVCKEDFYAVDAAHMLGIAARPQDRLYWNLTAVELAEKSADVAAKKWLGSLYNNIGWTYHDLNEYDKALGFFEKALAWRVSRGDERGTFIARWTIGRVYRSLGRIEEALAIQRGLLAEIQRKGLAPSGFVFEELGECLLVTNRSDEAKAYFKSAYEILSKDIGLKADEPARLERLNRLGE